MARSNVRSGKTDARDRATKRRRDRRVTPAAAVSPEKAHGDWLHAHRQELKPDLDLEVYLRDTAHIELSIPRRLRGLGWEFHSWAWPALKRIYTRALRDDPNDARTFALMGADCAHAAAIAHPPADSLFDEAYGYFSRARALAPSDVVVSCMNAYALYRDGRGNRTEVALELYDEALTLEPNDEWALLYRAHCLQNLKRWDDAIEAYDAVPRGMFQGPESGLMDLLVEERARCLWLSGKVKEAKAEFERILTRYESQPHLAEYGYLLNLLWAAKEIPSLRPRVEKLDALLTERALRR